MPRKKPPLELSEELQEAIDARRRHVEERIAKQMARDASTPPWLMSLRKYIDAAIDHHIAETERDEDGYASSDVAGQKQCEILWYEIVEHIQSHERLHNG